MCLTLGMHLEYNHYNFDKFGSGALFKRADEDQNAFKKFVQNNKVAVFSKNGYIQWQESDARRLLLEDIKAGKLEESVRMHVGQFWWQTEFLVRKSHVA